MGGNREGQHFFSASSTGICKATQGFRGGRCFEDIPSIPPSVLPGEGPRETPHGIDWGRCLENNTVPLHPLIQSQEKVRLHVRKIGSDTILSLQQPYRFVFGIQSCTALCGRQHTGRPVSKDPSTVMGESPFLPLKMWPSHLPLRFASGLS